MKRFPRTFALSFAIATLVAVCLALTPAARSEAAASGLTLAQACAADGTASLYFGWQGANPAAKELWLDVLSLGDGLRPAAIVSAGPLSPDTRAYGNWSGFAAGGTYHIRLNQLMWDGTWDPSSMVSFTTFSCSYVGASSSGSTAAAAVAKSTVSATGFASSNSNSVSSTGLGPAPNSLSSTAYTLANGGSTTVAADILVIQPIPPPTNTNTYYMPVPGLAAGPTAATVIPSAGSGATPNALQ